MRTPLFALLLVFTPQLAWAQPEPPPPSSQEESESPPIDTPEAPAPEPSAPSCDSPALDALLGNASPEQLARAEQLCPLPKGLIDAQAEDRLWGRTGADGATLRRDLSAVGDALSARFSPWGSVLARQIQTSADVARGQVRTVDFARVRTPRKFADADVYSCGCTFVTGSANAPDRACFRLTKPDSARCDSAVVHEFSDWAAMAPAFYLLELARRGLTQLDQPARSEAKKALIAAGNKWDALRKDGYLQYPWELVVSRLGSRYRDFQACFASDDACDGKAGLAPQRLRAIFLHPSLGLAFSGFGALAHSSPSAKGRAALNLELVGVTYYTRSFRQYVGVSAGGSFIGFDFAKPYVGPFVHVTRWVHAGYGWCVAGSKRKDGALIVSFDVASWVSSLTGVSFIQ